MSTCSGRIGGPAGCGALIEWVIVERTGKRMPIDVEPVPHGNIVKTGNTDVSGAARVEYVKPDPVTDQQSLVDTERAPRYVSHFATCPQAAAFRKAKP